MYLFNTLVLLSILLSIAGSFTYIRNTLKGQTKPNKVSWSLWALAPLIGTGAALNAGAGLGTTSRIFMSGFLPLIVFVSSFLNKKSYWKLTRFDGICGALSFLAILAWLAVGMPKTAILLAAIGDGFASLPTIRKAWIAPETETGFTFVAGLVSTLLILPLIPEWNIENSAFQIYLLISNSAILFSIYRKRIKRFQ